MFEYTIIIVSLNTKKKFLKTINSVKKQEYKNYEMIIVDGESKDGTIKEIKKLESKNIKYIIEKDKGIYDAMNKGIKLSRGKWLIFMNSGDNFVNKNILKKLSKKNFSDQNIIFGDTIINHNFIKVYKEGKYLNDLTVKMPFCHQSTLVRAKLLKKNFFSLKYKLSADFNFFLNCHIKKHKFLYFNDTISVVESSGISDTKRQMVFNENIKILRKKNKKNLITKVYIIKSYQYLASIIKSFLPNNIIVKILKFKYRNLLLK